MPYNVPIDIARAQFPEYTFVTALTPSAQKAAFHVRDSVNNDLCLKLIAPNYGRDRLDREILALQSIQNPNVVCLRDYVFSSKQGEQKHYIVEEFVDGSDLSDRLQPGVAWSPDEAAEFLEALCNGLSALQDQEIVHRDLKPSNIRVRPDGSPVIIDFGLARHLALPDLTATAQGAQIGTPAYFAPEQFSGTKHDIDCRTDLFAAGILMYQALVGHHPFWQPGMLRPELRDAICNSEDFRRDPAFLALPNRWKLLVGRMLEKERVKRPHNAHQITTILRQWRMA